MATTAADGGVERTAVQWDEALARALVERFGADQASRMAARYERAFDAGYRERHGPEDAARDIEFAEALGAPRPGTGNGSAESAVPVARPQRPEEMEGDADAAANGGATFRAPLTLDVCRAPGASDLRAFRCRFFHLGTPVHLSDSLPMLENMGLRVEDEHPHALRRLPDDGPEATVWLHDFGLRHRSGVAVDLDEVGDAFRECFIRVWSYEAEDDGFNRLALGAGLAWREIVLLRAYARYLRQLHFGLSQEYIEDTLGGNPDIVRDLVRLFHARFDPGADAGAGPQIVERILAGLEAVSSLDEDRILRTFLELVDATLRTNFYQRAPDGGVRPCLGLKVDPSCVHAVPAPRPRFEIFVHSPRLEGLHLRGGPIARGGIRWSDRREDFRTEILGLLKTQMVKNSLIVPVGAKGGFVLKRAPADGEALRREGLACYREFISTLLELTDNYGADGEIVPPPDTLRHDGDDPYLVVAADKGTATFSDTANELSTGADFWLGDAFASGGSYGYDHKGIGITARGAWESVRSHFRVLGRGAPEEEAFTATGIGDMSGDVFGNGMLRSRRMKLVAAFSHLHVFIDPDPDPEASFEERERLFWMPGSTWGDYDEELISAGGGVWPRTAKSIPLSAQAVAALGMAGEPAAGTPNDIIRAILQAPVDLLWNGGIGTYVKASAESHAMVGDRANDGVRVNARDLRCRAVAEGGNLGFTQRARIEYAKSGGLINTDAIDNSGGVDCSDHEVNLKILLGAAVAEGALTMEERNRVLGEMTDEVARQVLRNNYQQNAGLMVARRQAPPLVHVHERLIARLERTMELDRAQEGLPERDEMVERHRAGEGLTGPELAVLVAYVKLELFNDVIDTGVPEDPEMVAELANYFPTLVRERFAERIPRHRLAREIVTTMATNEMVNRCGISFAFRIGEEIGATPEDVVRAYFALREIYRLPEWFELIESSGLGAEAHVAAALEMRKLMDRSARWLLRNGPRPFEIGAAVERYRDGVGVACTLMRGLMPDSIREEVEAAAETLGEAGVPAELLDRFSLCSHLPSALDITEVAWRCRDAGVRAGAAAAGSARAALNRLHAEAGAEAGAGASSAENSQDSGSGAIEPLIEAVARAWHGVDALLDIGWLQAQIDELSRTNRWGQLARGALRGDLLRYHRILAFRVLEEGGGARPDAALRTWRNANARAIQRWSEIIRTLKAEPMIEYPMIAVALRELREVGRVSG